MAFAGMFMIFLAIVILILGALLITGTIVLVISIVRMRKRKKNGEKATAGQIIGIVIGCLMLAVPLTVSGVVAVGIISGNAALPDSTSTYESVDTIANSTGATREKVIKNIKKILKKGFFPEGFLDEQETTFMVSKEVYEQYLLAENGRKAKEQEDLERQKNNQMTTAEQTELDVMISKGNQYITRLRQLNDNIPGQVITEKLTRLEGLLGEIFDRVREHPDQMVNCRKLMDYYLPTMIKLVEAYEEYDKVSSPGEDIKAAKNEIEKTLDIINQAFVELLNKLYQSSVWDVKAEANVLKTMLRQEGLADDRFKEASGNADLLNETVSMSVQEDDDILIEEKEQVEVPVVNEI